MTHERRQRTRIEQLQRVGNHQRCKADHQVDAVRGMAGTVAGLSVITTFATTFATTGLRRAAARNRAGHRAGVFDRHHHGAVATAGKCGHRTLEGRKAQRHHQ